MGSHCRNTIYPLLSPARTISPSPRHKIPSIDTLAPETRSVLPAPKYHLPKERRRRRVLAHLSLSLSLSFALSQSLILCSLFLLSLPIRSVVSLIPPPPKHCLSPSPSPFNYLPVTLCPSFSSIMAISVDSQEIIEHFYVDWPSAALLEGL